MMKGAIVVDQVGDRFTTDDEQTKIWTRMFASIFNNEIKFKRYAHPTDIPLGVDVVLFDYGAAGLLSEAQVSGNIRGLFHWCSDNPHALAIIVSEFTWHSIIDEFDVCPETQNIILWGRDKIPAWFEGPVNKIFKAVA